MFAEEEYEAAKLAFQKASELNPSEKKYMMWIRKCDAEIEDEIKSHEPSKVEEITTTSEVTQSEKTSQVEPINEEAQKKQTQQAEVTKPKQTYRHEWFQSDDIVTVEIFAKGITEDKLSVLFEKRHLEVTIKIDDSSEYTMDIVLAGEIDVSQSSYTIKKTKIEIRLKKVDSLKWRTLESKGEDDVSQWDSTYGESKSSISQYPSSKGNKNWDTLTDEEDKLQGDAELNRLFQDIFSKGSDEQKKAMLKSFYESGGTVLSTNWDEVGKAKVDVSPPKGLEVHRWDENK